MTSYLRTMILAVVCMSPVAGRAEDMPMPSKNAADQAFMRSMSSMDAAMKAPMSGNPDKDFVTMMLPHHVGAVAMANVELQYGKDPELLALARSIVASQEPEIAAMRKWQAAHGK